MVLIGWYHALRERPDCIICFHLNFMPAVLPLARLLRSPYVGVLHGIEAWNPLPASRRRALASADWLYAVSRFTLRSSAARHGLDLAKASLLPCSFDESRFSPGPKPDNLLSRYGLHIDQPIALTVARVDRSERYKGHETMLAAMPGILNRCPNMRYIVAGTGDDLGYLKSEALRLGVADSVIFTGFIPTEELPDLYRLCDIFVMPSKAEGFGIVFLEAWQAVGLSLQETKTDQQMPWIRGVLACLSIRTTKSLGGRSIVNPRSKVPQQVALSANGTQCRGESGIWL
nr:glycosyltransferase family 4 protein [Verrucomicrobium spinosum]